MKKYIILIYLLFCFLNIFSQIDIRDTIKLNYYIASGEFGGRNEGLYIIQDNDSTIGTYVKYRISSYGISLNIDSITDYYKRNINNIEVIKKWKLNKTEVVYFYFTKLKKCSK